MASLQEFIEYMWLQKLAARSAQAQLKPSPASESRCKHSLNNRVSLIRVLSQSQNLKEALCQ